MDKIPDIDLVHPWPGDKCGPSFHRSHPDFVVISDSHSIDNLQIYMFSAGIALCVTLKYIAGEFIHAGEGLAIGFPHHLIIVVVKHFRGAGNRNRTGS